MANSSKGTQEPATAAGAESSPPGGAQSAASPPRNAESPRKDPLAGKGGGSAGGRHLQGFNRRWVFMFFLFIYLMALAMTLFEIDAFQTLVAQVAGSTEDLGTAAGNSRQREVLQAVRNTRPAGSEDGEETLDARKQALYERVAAKLDPMRVAVDTLADIGPRARLTVRDDATYKRAQQDAFRGLADRLGLAVIDLQEQVKSLSFCGEGAPEGSSAGGSRVAGEPGRSELSCTKLNRLRDFLVELNQGVTELEILLPANGGSDLTPEAKAAEASNRAKQAAELKKELNELIGKLTGQVDAHKKTIEGEDRALFNKFAQELVSRLDELQFVDPAYPHDVKRRSYAEKGAVQPTGTGTTAGAAAAPKLKAITVRRLDPGTSHPQVADLRRALRAYGVVNNPQRYQAQYPTDQKAMELMDQALEGFVKLFQEDAGIQAGAAAGQVGPATMRELNSFVEACNNNPQCFGVVPALPVFAAVAPADAAPGGDAASGTPTLPSVDEGTEIRRLRTALKDLRNFVARQDVNLRDISRLTAYLATVEIASRRLSDLNVIVETVEGEDQSAADRLGESRRKYQQAILDLAESIKGIRNTLANAGGVIPIADAIGDQDPLAHKKAATILREHDALGRYQAILTPFAFLSWPRLECAQTEMLFGEDTPQFLNAAVWGLCQGFKTVWNWITGIGFHVREMSTMTRQALDMMVVFVMGAIGSLAFLIRYLLSQILLGKEQGSAVWRPMQWYVFRPLFGIVVAFALYLLYKTGQVALGGGNANVLASDVNLPILSIFSLFAGLLSWQALEMVEKKGRAWLSVQQRENLWASGLARSLRTAGKTNADCASQLGVTPNQIDRWIAGQDKVTPEMQDRITTWLDRPRVEIFSEINPRDVDEGTLAWATGLKGALKANKAGVDVPRLAQLIGQDVETVYAWVEMKRQVDQETQFLIAEKLGEPRDKLFTAERPDAEYWAVGLRTALHKGNARHATAAGLAQAVGSTQQNIRRYMELRDSVPQTLMNLIAEAVELDHHALFSPNLPLDSEFKWAAKLRECLRASEVKDCVGLAEKIDTEAPWVRGWMEQEICGEEDPPYCGQVAPETQLILLDALKCEAGHLFRAERAAGDFLWVTTPRFEDLVKSRGGVAELASRLDLDVVRIERWIAGSEPVAPETQLALLADLGLPVEERASLFTSRPPMDPERPEGVWWTTGLRDAVRDHPGYRNLADLAAELEVPVETLYDQVEMLTPVPMDLRDRIKRLLGATSAHGGTLFSTQGPDWSEFRWAPELRSSLAEADNVDSSELAEALDIDVRRVRDWMEMEKGDPGSQWAKGKVKRGQICRSTCDAIHKALGGVIDRQKMFTVARPDSGALWAIKPTFRIAVEAFDGKLAGFAEQVDVDPERVVRWMAQDEPVESDTKERIRNVLGLKEEDEGQLFASKKKTVDAQG